MQAGFLGYGVDAAFIFESEEAQHFEAYGTIHGSANLEMNSCWLMLTRTVEPGPSLSIKLYLLNGVFVVVPADFGPCDLATPTPI